MNECLCLLESEFLKEWNVVMGGVAASVSWIGRVPVNLTILALMWMVVAGVDRNGKELNVPR